MQTFMENWNSLSLFYSASTSQKYLFNCYQYRAFSNSEALSYQNCQSFMNYIEHAHTYHKEASSASLSIRPILQFYGLIQLLKACILTIDPFYPSSTTLLAHGVSSRKRKKQNYLFMEDEIKIQRHGLFTHISEEMFHMKHLENEKVTMGKLVTQIPELVDELSYFNLSHSIILQTIKPTVFVTSNKLLDTLHMTSDRLEQYFREKFNIILQVTEKSKELYFSLEHSLCYNYHFPFQYNLLTNRIHLLPSLSIHKLALKELQVHYLLLYNLSMIARYETEWWLDLLKTRPTIDYPIIRKFLITSQEKIPFLISNWLLSQHAFTK